MNALSPGDLVSVRPDAPHYAGQPGTVMAPEVHGSLPGHWIELDRACEIVWIPEAALDRIEAGELR